MSLKLYYGFRFTGPDIADLMVRLSDWRRELDALKKDKEAALMARLFTKRFDMATLGRPVEGGIDLSAIWREIRDRRAKIRATGFRDPEVDFDMDISVFLHEDRWYGLVMTEQNDWTHLWMEKPFIEDFSFWDNTDPPDGISDAAWAARGSTWHAILEPAGWIPARAGLKAEFGDRFRMPPDTNDVLAAIPDFPTRCIAAARARFIDQVLAALPKTDSFTSVSGNFFSASQQFETDLANDGPITTPLMEEMKRCLVPTITSEMLLGRTTAAPPQPSLPGSG